MTQIHHQTILIVDDTPTNLDVLANALINAGYQVAVALDGETAIAQSNYKPPQLILLDVMMPGIDGFETCRRLKSNPQTQAIPVIFMTALSEAINKSKGFDLGAVDYITKPFEVEEVLARVNTHLKLYRLTSQLEEEVAHKTAELTAALDQLQYTQIQLMYGERMSLIGELSAGLAYEISNPINFISGNLGHISNYFNQLLEFVDYHTENNTNQEYLYLQKVDQKNDDIALKRYDQRTPKPELDDLEFLRADLPKILSSFQRGVSTIQKLVSTLHSFAHSDKFGRKKESVHSLIDNCIILIGHKLQQKHHSKTIKIIRSYQEDIPLLECYPTALSQAFMSIILAYIATLETSFKENKPDLSSEILIKTKCDSSTMVLINISIELDNIFSVDSFNFDGLKTISNILSSSQIMEKGIGMNHYHDMSLLIANDIVVQKHGGCLKRVEQPGKTEIIFELKQILDQETIERLNSL